jgi:hypothetical protein
LWGGSSSALVAGSESRSACAIWRRGAVPASFAFCPQLFLTAALLDLGAEFRGGINLAQVTGTFRVVTDAMLPLLLRVAFGQVGEVGCHAGLETRDPLFARLLLPAQECILGLFAFAGVFGRLLRIEFRFDCVDEPGDAGRVPMGFAQKALPGGLLQGIEVAELLPGFCFKDVSGLSVFGLLPEAHLAGFFRMAFAGRPLKGGDLFYRPVGRR